MARYRVQLYGVPDQHLYDPLRVKIWRTWWRASGQRKVALVCAGAALGLLAQLVGRL